MSLFQKSVVNKYLKNLDRQVLLDKWNAYKNHFLNPSVQVDIRNLKEEQYQGEFLEDLFVKILGYTKPASSSETKFNLTTEYKNVKDSKKADGAIIFEDKVKAVIELKGTNTTDLGKIEVQAFGYKNNQPDCVYVITSNFEKLRFYIDNAIEHIEFNLFTLTEEEFQLLYLCLGYENLSQNLPKKIKDESLSEEDVITKKLYKDYSLFKRELHQNLVLLNPNFEPIELFKKSQKLLDRFLFLFFGEDRHLLPPNSVRQIITDWNKLQDLNVYMPLYDRFKEYFRHLNTGFKSKNYDVFAYNGGLFKPDEVLDSISIDDNLLYKHTLKLSEYDFASEVDVNILGHIFENSLNELDEIKAQLEGQEIDKTKTKRKKDGVFYTPKYITKYIVENTVGKLCEEKKLSLEIIEEEYFTDKKRQKKTIQGLVEKLDTYRKWLLQLTICDPACGSGAFLNQALDFLIEEHQYIDELQAKLFGDALVMSDIENSILENNLFGVDLNEESVEIAKLSLWLRTAQPNRKLNDLNGNIKCGNSLIDDVTVAGEKAFNWQQAFPKVFEKGGFDVVIGNPPYVRQELLSKIDKDFFVKNYKTGNGTADLYVYFYELALDILKQNGVLAYITPNKFYKTKYGKQLRQLLIEYKIIGFIDFFELKVFEDASTDSQILILEKNKNTLPFNYSPIKNIVDFRDNNYSKLEINPKNLSDEIWVFNNSNDLNILNKMNSVSITLDEYTNNGIFRGITTGLNEAFIIDEETKNKIINEDPKSAELLKPYVTATDIERYYLKNPNQLFFINTFYDLDITKYKGIHNWLINFDEKLQKRQDKGIHHFNLRACKYYEKFEQPKIIYIHTAVKHKFFYDEAGYYINNSCYLISNADKFLSVWLNSKIFSFYKKLNFVAYGDSSESGRAKLDYNKMVNVPVPNINTQQKQPFIEKADLMLNLNKELQEQSQIFLTLLQSDFNLEKPTTKIENWYNLTWSEFEKELNKLKIILLSTQKEDWFDRFNRLKTQALDLQNKISQTDKAINTMVYELYGLNEEEIALVENS
jgi:type I restriction-modification system DNA methylase subunit